MIKDDLFLSNRITKLRPFTGDHNTEASTIDDSNPQQVGNLSYLVPSPSHFWIFLEYLIVTRAIPEPVKPLTAPEMGRSDTQTNCFDWEGRFISGGREFMMSPIIYTHVYLHLPPFTSIYLCLLPFASIMNHPPSSPVQPNDQSGQAFQRQRPLTIGTVGFSAGVPAVAPLPRQYIPPTLPRYCAQWEAAGNPPPEGQTSPHCRRGAFLVL